MKMTKAEKEFRRQLRLIKNWYERYQEYYEGERDALYVQYLEKAKAQFESAKTKAMA